MELLVAFERRALKRRGGKLAPKPFWFRAFLETPLNLAGGLLGAAIELAGPRFFWGLHQRAFRVLAGGKGVPLDPRWAASLEGARRLHGELSRRMRREPGVLALQSHPPVADDISALNFEIMRRAYEAIAAARGRPTAIRSIVAIDGMALGAAPWWQEGPYAGVMNRCHLAIDRQPSLRGPLQARLLRASLPERLPWRLARLLRSGGNATMILAGGVPTTGRLLYALKEFLIRLRRAAPRHPGLARTFELRLARLLAGLDEPGLEEHSPLETGMLSPETRREIERWAEERGVPLVERRRLLDDFAAEFRRLTPYRERFFNFLFRRVVPKAPLLLLPVSHRDRDRPVIRLGRAVGLVARSTGGGDAVEVLSLEGSDLTVQAMKPGEFARSWVSASFD